MGLFAGALIFGRIFVSEINSGGGGLFFGRLINYLDFVSIYKNNKEMCM